MRAILLGVLLTLVGSAWGNTSVHAQADTLRVTFEEAQSLALERNPAFLADEQTRGIAGGQLREARTYAYNPELEFEAPGTITNGVDTYDAWLWQEVEWAGQRGLRIDAAEHGVAGAEGFVADAARRMLADVGVAFYATVAAQRRVEVAEGLLSLNTRLLEAVRTQVAEGEISQMDANFGEIETGRARALVLSTRREAETVVLEFGRLLGRSPDAPVRAVEGEDRASSPLALDVDSLVERALTLRPDLSARVAEERRRETLARLNKREAIPNLRLGAVLSREAASGATRWGFGVGLPLPFWNRNQGIGDAVAAASRQATLDRTATELRVRTEVEQAIRAYQTAEDATRILETDVLDPARENQVLLEIAYREGRIGLADLVLLRNQLINAELGYWDAWFTLRSSWVGLQAAVGDLRDPRSNAETPEEQ